MTVHTPAICANSVMSAYPGGTNKVLLLDTNGYPASSILQNNTWEFTGTDWSEVSSGTVMDASGPLPGRQNAAMSSFDGTNLVLFGGKSANTIPGVLEDTWEFTGTWAQVAVANGAGPVGRFRSSMAYLAGTGAVMFGGATTAETPLGDTWVFSAGAWTQVTVANGAGPSARSGHSMAAGGGKVLLFGGKGALNFSNSLWSFASGAWTQIVLANGASPSDRVGASLVYDVTASLFVLFGGVNSAGVVLNDTWTFNTSGNVWTQVTVANGVGPSGRVNAQMAYDATSAKTVLFGGVSATTMEADNQTWALTTGTGTWAQL